MRFLAHIVMKPNDGKPLYTVETEFEATNWGSAYEHCLGLGQRFNSVVQSHRLRALGTDNAPAGPVTTGLPALPAPVAAPPKPAAPEWAGLVTVAAVQPQPWPHTNSNLNG